MVIDNYHHSAKQHRFLAGGDYNAKHTHWGSRLTAPRGRELLKAMQKENLMYVSTGEPTYWPSDKRKVPNHLDFGIMKGIPAHSIQAVAGFDLSSDHSPVLLTMHTRITPQTRPPTHPNLKNDGLGDFSKLYKRKPYPPSSP